MKKTLLILASLTLLMSCTHNSTTTPSTPKESATIASPTYGNGTKNVTFYTDFQCPACIAFSQVIEPIFIEYADK
jgi:protein-disulfide isomerase